MALTVRIHRTDQIPTVLSKIVLDRSIHDRWDLHDLVLFVSGRWDVHDLAHARPGGINKMYSR